MERLLAALAHWRTALRSVGESLLEMEQAGAPVDTIIHTVVRGQGMPAATARCALRWARGELGDDQRANLLLAQVPHSLLQGWSNETVTDACEREHVICTEQGNVAPRALAEMTRREVARNTNTQGFIPIAEQVSKAPQWRSCTAERVEVNDDGVTYLVATSRETIRMRVPERVMKKLMESQEALCGA